MVEHTTLRKNGGWRIELINPVGAVDAIEIAPPTLQHTIRWKTGKIPSVLAFLSELANVKESVFCQLTGQDTERVLTAFSLIAPQAIKDDFSNGSKPLATPELEMTPEQRYEAADQLDDIDPRFPKVEGPVKRFKDAPTAEELPDSGGMAMRAPGEMRKVG